MMMMVPSKAKSGSTRAQGDLKASRLSRNGSTKSDAPKPRGLVDRPTKSFESKVVSSKNSTTSTPSKPSLQQGRSEAVEVELKKETVARMRAEEILAAERRRIKELEEELQIKHERDVSSLSCMAEELRRAKEELRAAEGEKETILREVDDAKRAAKVHEEKAALATKEACDRKALHESLKSELERARIAEEKLVHMESLIEKLQIEATDARIGESDASALVDEWRSKAERLTADLEEAHQSEKSASDSLADMMVKLEESKSLFQDAEAEISILRARISSSEIESARQKIDLEESNRQLESARQDALNIGETVELLKLELRRLEEEKSKSLTEENARLAGELKLSIDEAEKASEAMECLALEFKAMSIGAREKEERLTRMQTEIEESNKEIERLSRVLRNTEERYEVMLDEARYELVCLKNRCEEEQSFVCTIRRLEEEIASLKAEMATRVELQEIDEHEKNESIDDMEPANSNSIPDDDEEEEEEEEPSENEVSNAEVLEYTENGYREGHGEEETETVDDDLDSKMNADGGIDHANGTERRRLPRKKKKKTLLYNFGNLLKKGNH